MTSHKGNIHWFKKHPEFLRRESTALSNDSNYQEIHQCRSELFLSHGNILVRLDELYKYPILIMYPEASPYQLPVIFALKQEMTVTEVELLSKMSRPEIYPKIQSNIKLYQQYRHQNGSGALCFVESESLDNGSNFYSIKNILKRVRDWYTGHHTGNFPPDSIEVEFTSHFSFLQKEIQFIYSEEFLTSELVAGQFWATLIRHFGEGYPYVYRASLIDGITKAGILVNGEYLLHPLKKTLLTSLDFSSRKVEVAALVNEKVLLTGLWFHIDTVLKPFTDFDELIKIIGGGDFEVGILRFMKIGTEFFNSLHDRFVVGVRYPNNKNQLEFQLIEVSRDASNRDLLKMSTPDTKMKSILSKYKEVAAIGSEKITEENFHARNSLRAKHDILVNKEVNLFGVGSIGSEIADSLGKAGLGTIKLFDNQALRAHNAIRHLAGLQYTGWGKVSAVKDIINDHNPFVFVDAELVDFFAVGDLLHQLPVHSISVSSIADDNVEGFINEQAVFENRTVFYVRALRGGKVGRIFRVIPGKDACFQCLTQYMADDGSLLKIANDASFPTLMNECNNPIRPASAADLKIISSIASRLIVEHLQDGESPYNHWIWSTESLPENNVTTPYSMLPSFNAPHPKCYYCKPGQKNRVTVDAAILDFMKGLVEEKRGIETGGVLAGIVDVDGNIEVVAASPPGPNASHSATEFRKDVAFCQEFLDNAYVTSDRKVVYVGEWHSHPCSSNAPSALDIKSLTEISQQKDYLTTNPVMIIFSSTGAPSGSIHPVNRAHYFVPLEINQTDYEDGK